MATVALVSVFLTVAAGLFGCKGLVTLDGPMVTGVPLAVPTAVDVLVTSWPAVKVGDG